MEKSMVKVKFKLIIFEGQFYWAADGSKYNGDFYDNNI